MRDAQGRGARVVVARRRLRTALLASAAAVAPLAALSLPAQPVEAAPKEAFAPGDEPMVLTRVLRRPLPGGAEVSTSRSYEIRFVREGDGYRIDGALVDVEVKAPAALDALAALERSRPDAGMFPMRVDGLGRLVPVSPAVQDGFARKASGLALALVPAGLASGEARDARAFIGQVGANPALTAWPDDLFMPRPGKRDDRHVIPLPGGRTGEVAIEIEARVQSGSGLLSVLRRHVTTTLGGSSRATEETWTLARKD